MIERLTLKERQVEFICNQALGNMTRESRMTFYGRKLARSTSFIRDPVLLPHAEGEVRIVIKEKRGDVVIEDEEQYVRPLLCQPCLDWSVSFEYGGPHRIGLLLGVERKADGRRMRRCNATQNLRHVITPKTSDSDDS